MNTATKKTPAKKARSKKVASKALAPKSDDQLITVQPSMTDQLLTLAVDKDLDMDKLERLIEMKDREEEKTARSLFNVAMATVQKDIQPIIADAENDHTGSTYAKLCTIVSTLAPIYTEQGFSVSYGQAECSSHKLVEDGWFRTTAELSHAGGFSKQYFVDLPADIRGSAGTINKTLIHGTKSTITYARGILMGLMFNFTTSMDVDTDGNRLTDTITDEQAATMRDHLSVFDDPAAAEKDLVSWLKVSSLEDIPVRIHSKAQKAIAEQKKAEGKS